MRSKALFLLLNVVCFLSFRQQSFAQDSSAVVSWDFSAVKGANGNNTLVLHGKIKDGWRLYSTTMADSLPNSRVVLDTTAKTSIGNIDEQGKPETVKEPLFNNTATRSFENDITLQVHLKPVESGGYVKGKVVYMAIYKDSVVGPNEVPFRYAVASDGTLAIAGLQEGGGLNLTAVDLKNPVNSCGGTGTVTDTGTGAGAPGLLRIFFLGILGGLIALFMPCTFPMIPLTVSFFTKRSGSRQKGIANAFLYGFFIFLIYVLISVPFYFLKSNNASILNSISTNVWLNISFSVIFFVFALSFFGLFEITLPSSISNSVDSKSSIGSLGGIFFMALTLVIVSFSCTGPILGTLLVGALGQNGGAVQLTAGMAGFGIALGLPFALFALFPSWLQSLPKSGGWMTTLKIVFGFIELALMLKYFSNADLVSHWGILKRETFFAIWILIGLALSLYLFGILKFKHDPPPARLSKGRIAIATFFLLFSLYLAPGVTNTKYANLSLVSGFPPPLTYSLYGKHEGDEGRLDAMVINDFDKALQMAKEQHKPILIDFTGWACTNCRKMEESVWPAPEVKSIIKNNYILVSLYVDDRKPLPEDQQYVFTMSDGSKKQIKTIGDKYFTLQTENFKAAVQPYYVVISPDEKLLTHPVPYTPDPKDYAQWLQCGLDAFHKQ